VIVIHAVLPMLATATAAAVWLTIDTHRRRRRG
jgi:hypothetical protein